MTNPKYTFLLPAYKAKYFEEALRSIKTQTFRDFRVLVSDDCSPEPLKPIFDRVCGGDPRFTFRRNAKNMGGKSLVAHWNLLVDMCDTDFVIMASDDDVYEPEFLEEIDKLVVKYPKVDLFRASMRYIDEEGKQVLKDEETCEYADAPHFFRLYNSGVLLFCEANYCYRTSALKANNGYVEFPLAWYTDEATHLLMAKNGCAMTNKKLFNFRRSSEGITEGHRNSATYRKKTEAAIAYYKWLNDYKSTLQCNDEASLVIYAYLITKKKIKTEVEQNLLHCNWKDFRSIASLCKRELGMSAFVMYYYWLHLNIKPTRHHAKA